MFQKKNKKFFSSAVVISLTMISIIFLIRCSSNNSNEENFSLHNRFSKLILRSDLSGIVSYIDSKTKRNYISQNGSELFILRFGKDYEAKEFLTPSMAIDVNVKKNDNSLIIKYKFNKSGIISVICKISTQPTDSLIYWDISVENISNKVLSSIQYPILPASYSIAKNKNDGGLIYPLHEGAILTGMHEPGAYTTERYPGTISAQLIYFFDSSGGIYYAAYDGNGYPKNITASNSGKGIDLIQEFFLPIEAMKNIEMPYQVATGCFGGRWEDGAAIYREWSDKQKWTEKTISQRDIPDWLKKPTMFLNIFHGKDEFSTVKKADRIIKAYHKYYGVSVNAVGFGWEKNGSWIGPDYFPLVRGEEYYKNLTKILAGRNDHLHFYTSGFRYGVRKPVETDGKAEVKKYTNYDGREDFFTNWEKSAVFKSNDSLSLDLRSWAENYILCVGDKKFSNHLANIHATLYKLGVDGVDLDQNIGGEVPFCFRETHGHPKGGGIWQTEAMEAFFKKVRKDAKNISPNTFMGTEEPSEFYIQYLDAIHGRAFVGTAWPVKGPGAIAVPLYQYLYHQYQINYSGWFDYNFSPFNNIKIAIGRGFIAGVYPGVRVNETMVLPAEEKSDEIKMIKGYLELMKKYPKFLVDGRMIEEVEISGAKYFSVKPEMKTDTLLSRWQVVQGIVWQSSQNDEKIYAIANISNKVQNIKMKKIDTEKEDYSFEAYVKEKLISGNAKEINGFIELRLEPWQLSIVKKNKKTIS